MGYMGQILNYPVGLIGVDLLRSYTEYVPFIKEYHLDIIMIVVLHVGFILGLFGTCKQSKENIELKNEVSSVRDFSYIATLSFSGTSDLPDSGVLSLVTELARMVAGIFQYVEPEQYVPNCSDEALERARSTIAKYPKFPFTYYALAVCLRDRGDNEWRTYASQAMQILEKTSKIDGHHWSHNVALNNLRDILR
jgi:hypothetical protein